MSTKILVIYNTKSGQTDQFKQVQEAFAKHAMDVQYKKIHPQLTRDIAQARDQGRHIVVAAGGDGTVSSVAGQVHDTPLTLGVIPIGTLNHFAKDLQIPQDIAKAVQVIVEGEVKKIDVASVNNHIFINNSSIGLYPSLVRERERHQSRFGKWPAALWALGKVIARLKRHRVEIQIQTKKYMCRTPFIFIGNNSYRISKAGFTNRQTLDSGRLSVYWITTARVFRIMHIFLRALLGKANQDSDFESRSDVSLIIRSRHRRLQVACDGEVLVLKTPLRYTTHPRSLRVLVPRAQQR